MSKQIVGAAIELAGADDIVADAGDALDSIGDCRHARGDGKRADPALHLRYALFQHGGRGVHDARIDISRHREVEQIRAMLGIIERVGGRLIDRNRGRLGRWVRI